MVIKKIAELYFPNNDIYTLDSYNNTIIVNDNYQGLLLLNDLLLTEKKLILPQAISIYSLYKQYDKDSLLLYLPDSNQLIFINLETTDHYSIALSSSFDHEILSPNYYWMNNTLILTSFNHNLYQLDFSSKILHPISENTVKKNNPSFYNFWNTCKNYNILTFYPNEQCFVFQNNTNSLGFFNCQNNIEQIITGFTDGWHDVEYNNNIFLFIHEKKIEIIHNQNKIILSPQPDYIFLRAKFLNNNQIVILSSKPSNPRECLLEIYEMNR